MQTTNEKHYTDSNYRESLIEKRFLNELLTALWPEQVEVLRPEVDFAGYDLVLEARQQTRHVQLKTSMQKGSESEMKKGYHGVRGRLGMKPAGCVLWIVVDDKLAPVQYRWFGNGPGEPLPGLSEFRKARHTRHDATGTKKERQDTYEVPRRHFKPVPMEVVVEELFGPKQL